MKSLSLIVTDMWIYWVICEWGAWTKCIILKSLWKTTKPITRRELVSCKNALLDTSKYLRSDHLQPLKVRAWSHGIHQGCIPIPPTPICKTYPWFHSWRIFFHIPTRIVLFLHLWNIALIYFNLNNFLIKYLCMYILKLCIRDWEKKRFYSPMGIYIPDLFPNVSICPDWTGSNRGKMTTLCLNYGIIP